jgi:2-methylcitrate dehydratase
MAPAVAMGVGKLLGLNEDLLANALSLALVPHLPIFVTHAGVLSMWKGCHDAEAVRCGLWAALLAREGMTGPCQPFEGRGGMCDHIGPFKELRLPASPDGMLVQRIDRKRTPTEGNTQTILEVIPSIREWTKVDDIASIQIEMSHHAWQEIADPAKWDPRNRETADHSMPYTIAVALMDGEVYLDSFTPKRFLDPALRRLMEKITTRPNLDFSGPRARITVRTKTGGELTKDTLPERQLSHEEIIPKFNRICAFMSVTDDQRDRARAAWSNLRAVRDIAEPIRVLAHFGRPLPL